MDIRNKKRWRDYCASTIERNSSMSSDIDLMFNTQFGMTVDYMREHNKDLTDLADSTYDEAVKSVSENTSKYMDWDALDSIITTRLSLFPDKLTEFYMKGLCDYVIGEEWYEFFKKSVDAKNWLYATCPMGYGGIPIYFDIRENMEYLLDFLDDHPDFGVVNCNNTTMLCSALVWDSVNREHRVIEPINLK